MKNNTIINSTKLQQDILKNAEKIDTRKKHDNYMFFNNNNNADNTDVGITWKGRAIYLIYNQNYYLNTYKLQEQGYLKEVRGLIQIFNEDCDLINAYPTSNIRYACNSQLLEFKDKKSGKCYYYNKDLFKYINLNSEYISFKFKTIRDSQAMLYVYDTWAAEELIAAIMPSKVD